VDDLPSLPTQTVVTAKDIANKGGKKTKAPEPTVYESPKATLKRDTTVMVPPVKGTTIWEFKDLLLKRNLKGKQLA
jgi:hypothetical protein